MEDLACLVKVVTGDAHDLIEKGHKQNVVFLEHGKNEIDEESLLMKLFEVAEEDEY